MSIEASDETRPPDPKEFMHVFSLRRSGHNAVINWIRACLAAGGKTSELTRGYYDLKIDWSLSAESILAEGAGADVQVIDYNDASYRKRYGIPAYRNIKDAKPDTPARGIVIARDFYNLAASRMTREANSVLSARDRRRSPELNWGKIEDVWINHIGIIALNGSAGNMGFSDLTNGIIFNQWFADEQYRVDKATELGLANSDSTMKQVLDSGFGSSFSHTYYDGRADEMNVLERWMDVPEKLLPEYRAVILGADPMIDRYNVGIFGFGREQVLDAVEERLAS